MLSCGDAGSLQHYSITALQHYSMTALPHHAFFTTNSRNNTVGHGAAWFDGC
jgi:hypothetical protein